MNDLGRGARKIDRPSSGADPDRMATQVKFECYSEDLASGIHNWTAAGHAFKVALTNSAPNAATHTVLADITQIGTTGGYVTGGYDIQNDLSRSGGTTTITGVDVTITASGGAIGPFRYAVIYNDTSTGDRLVSYADYGSSASIADGESLLIDIGAALQNVV